MFKDEELLEILKILHFINNIEKYRKYGPKKHKSNFRLKQMGKTGNYFTEEIKQSELIIKKHKMVFKLIKYTGHLLILASTATECVSIPALPFLVDITVGIASFATTIKIFVIIARIKKYNSIIKKRKRNLIK